MKRLSLFCFLLIAVSFKEIFAGIVVPTDTPDLVEKIEPSVVHISTQMKAAPIQLQGWGDFLQQFGIPTDQQQSSLGSGFILDLEGYVLTNFHVVESATQSIGAEVMVTLMDKREFKARIIGRDAKTDLALLQIKDAKGAIPLRLLPVRLGDSEKTRKGEPVLAIGNPFGLDGSVSAGLISSKDRNIGQGPFDNFLQTDAAINPGNSGGPLFNFKGEVIGINSAIYSRTGQSAGIGFAIPINTAKQLLGDLKKFGRVPRPWVGVLSRKVVPQLTYAYGLPRKTGILITNLVQDGPADHAGLIAGDIIFEANGKAIQDPYDLERAISTLKIDAKVELTIQRGSKTIKKTLKLEEFPPRVDRVREGII